MYQYPTTRFFVGSNFQATDTKMQDIISQSVKGNATNKTGTGFLINSLTSGNVVKILVTKNPGSYTYSYTLNNDATFKEVSSTWMIPFKEIYQFNNLNQLKNSSNYTFINNNTSVFTTTVIDENNVLLNLKPNSTQMSVVQPRYLRKFSAAENKMSRLVLALDQQDVMDITVQILDDGTYKNSFRKSNGVSGGEPEITEIWGVPFDGLNSYTTSKNIFSTSQRPPYTYKNTSFSCSFKNKSEIYFRVITPNNQQKMSSARTFGSVPVNHELKYNSAPFIGSLANST